MRRRVTGESPAQALQQQPGKALEVAVEADQRGVVFEASVLLGPPPAGAGKYDA
jgi:hypothetical protein